MNILGIIPARFASSRFPGKPLADIQGMPMIQRVYERASLAGSLTSLVVATDDERILSAVKAFGGEAVMTSGTHPSGTDRCNEALSRWMDQGHRIDVVINIQGDEPFIHPEQIEQVCACFQDPDAGIATLKKRISTYDELFNPSVNKVITDREGHALYFSRHPIPFIRNAKQEDWLEQHAFYKHIGIYGYRAGVLKAISSLGPSPLEQAESLEQLRWLENGYRIQVAETTYESIAVDVPGDLSKFTNSP